MKAKLDPAWREHCKLRAEAGKLQAKAHNLRVEAHIFWRTKVTEVCGRVCGKNATIERTDTGCVVLGVMEFVYKISTKGEVP